MVTRILVVLLGAVLLTSCSNNSEVDASAFSELLEFREHKDSYFKDSTDSPILAEERSAFEGLRYYDPDTAYVVEAVFKPVTQIDTFMMQTNKELLRKAIRVGYFEFTLKSNPGRLAAYQFLDTGHSTFFVPFRDATNGKETYFTGRYLDINVEEDGSYLIDFNMAYNPLCAYNDSYSCPLVPAENELPFAIKAGERSWH